MDPNQIAQLISTHAWWALTAIVIGMLIRLAKSDTRLPINIPAQYRVWAALGLGVGAGVCDQLAHHVGWKAAIVWGLSAAVTAIIGHETIIESLRGGKEVPLLGLMNPPANDNETKKEAA